MYLKIASLYLRAALINEKEIFVFFFFSMSQFMLSPLSFPVLPYLVSVTNTTPRMKDDLLLHLQTAPNTPWYCSSFTYRIMFESSLPQDEFMLMNWVLVCAVSYYQQSHLHGVIEFWSTYYSRKHCWIFKVLCGSVAH